MFLLNTQIEVKLCCCCFSIYILIRLSKDMVGGDEQHFSKLFQYFTGSSILTKVDWALWCGHCWLIDLKAKLFFSLATLERCFSQAKLLFSWKADGLCNSAEGKQWFSPRQKQQFRACRFTKTNACHCYVSKRTRAVSWQWCYIVALEQDILLCCWKQMNRSCSPATIWRLKFKSNVTFKQMSAQEIKLVLSMSGIKRNAQFDIWK